jgi:hypothetical protein
MQRRRMKYEVIFIDYYNSFETKITLKIPVLLADFFALMGRNLMRLGRNKICSAQFVTTLTTFGSILGRVAGHPDEGFSNISSISYMLVVGSSLKWPITGYLTILTDSPCTITVLYHNMTYNLYLWKIVKQHKNQPKWIAPRSMYHINKLWPRGETQSRWSSNRCRKDCTIKNCYHSAFVTKRFYVSIWILRPLFVIYLVPPDRFCNSKGEVVPVLN